MLISIKWNISRTTEYRYMGTELIVNFHIIIIFYMEQSLSFTISLYELLIYLWFFEIIKYGVKIGVIR